MKGTISKITGGEAKSGGRYENWIINGEKYSTKKFVGNAQEGDTIEFEYLQNGDFKNLTKVELITQEQQSNTNDYIVREVAIKAAVEATKAPCFSSDAMNWEDMTVKTIKMAKEYEAYIKGSEGGPEDIPF